MPAGLEGPADDVSNHLSGPINRHNARVESNVFETTFIANPNNIVLEFFMPSCCHICMLLEELGASF